MESGNNESVRNQLIQLVSADFRTEANRERQATALPGSLSWLLARAVDPEEVETRLMSDENQQLGSEVRQILDAAAITEPFKGYIVNAVRDAHAHQAKVSDEVGAANLGLDDPDGGIFNPETAPAVEAGFLRLRLYNIINKYVCTAPDEGGQPVQATLYPQHYAIEMMTLALWIEEYAIIHDRNPFEGIDMEAYGLAARELQSVSPDSPEGEAWGSILNRLDSLRRQDNDQE